MQQNLVSVIIPSYNRARFIERAVKSVLAQTYSELELTVVDDASTDSTQDVLSRIKDSRLKVIVLDKNSGACTARNIGVQNANGEFIAFNDSDDMWHTDKIEKQLAFLRRTEAAVCFCAMMRMRCNGEALSTFPRDEKEGRITYEQLLRRNSASTQTFFGRSQCFKDTPFDKEMPRLQDWDEMLRLSQKYDVFFQNETLVDTFIQPDSITSHPEKGVRAMERLFAKHSSAIMMDQKTVKSFFRKKSAFVCMAGGNPGEEMQTIWNICGGTENFVRYSLSKLGIYGMLFRLFAR